MLCSLLLTPSGAVRAAIKAAFTNVASLLYAPRNHGCYVIWGRREEAQNSSVMEANTLADLLMTLTASLSLSQL
jgi:hypothetical protein